MDSNYVATNLIMIAKILITKEKSLLGNKLLFIILEKKNNKTPIVILDIAPMSIVVLTKVFIFSDLLFNSAVYFTIPLCSPRVEIFIVIERNSLNTPKTAKPDGPKK